MIGQVMKLEFTTRRMGWRFPPDRFISYDAEDERRALELGWSAHGGRLEEKIQTIVVPNAVITSMKGGEVEFKCYPELTNT